MKTVMRILFNKILLASNTTVMIGTDNKMLFCQKTKLNYKGSADLSQSVKFSKNWIDVCKNSPIDIKIFPPKMLASCTFSL